MRATSLKMVAATFALSLGVASVSVAQNGQPRGQRSGKANQTWGAQRSMDAALLKGIKLSSTQKEQLKQLEQRDKQQQKSRRDAVGGNSTRDAKTTVGAWDSATVMARRGERQQYREQHVLALRSILNSDQRVQFETNLEEVRQRADRDGVSGNARRIRGRHDAGRVGDGNASNDGNGKHLGTVKEKSLGKGKN